MPSIKPASTRFVEIASEDRSPRQEELVRRVEAGPRGRLPINLKIWLSNPDFFDAVEPFGLYVSNAAPLTKRQKEILVLVGAKFWNAEYEWKVHVEHAAKAGITEEQISAIAMGQVPEFSDPAEIMTHQLVTALYQRRPASDEIYQRATALLGQNGVTDIIGLIGLYTMISMTLNFYNVRPEVDGMPSKF